MTTTKKAASGGISTGDGGQQITLPGFETLSGNEFITRFEAAQGTIAGLLPRGRRNALTTRELCRITGQAPREITRRSCTERRAGAPILSDTAAGFWIAEDADELRRCTAQLHRRAGEIHRTASALEKCVKEGRKE